MSDSIQEIIMEHLEKDSLWEFGLPIKTRGSTLQQEIAQAAIDLAKAGKVYLQKREHGEYLVSLDPPAEINQRTAIAYQKTRQIQEENPF